MKGFDTPLLLIIFNRPDKVRAIIDALAAVRPRTIYISADGPRAHVATDQALCAEARAAAQEIPWPCEIITNFSDTNLGIDKAVEKALGWVFDREERAVILEDDCLPHPDFFRFAEELLVRYKDDDRIMAISGDNFQHGVRRGDASYYFSRYPNIWGWATWRRAWKKHDPSLSALPQFIARDGAGSIRSRKVERRYWLAYFESLRSGKRTSWDAKWVFTVWNNDGLCISPNANLVENMGFGNDATNTTYDDPAAKIHRSSIENPLRHPAFIAPDESADRYLFDKIYRVTFRKRLHHLTKKLYGAFKKP